MHQFDEHHPEFSGFSAYFADEIGPVLALAETDRQAALRNSWKAVAAAAALMVGIMALLFWKQAPVPAYLWTVFAGGLLGLVLVAVMTGKVAAKTKGIIVGGVCKFLGLRFQPELEKSPQLEAFIALGLIKRNFDRSSFEDHISGQAHGARFLVHEAHLEQRVNSGKRRSWRTVFRGQFLTLEFDRKFLGRTVVLRDKGWFNAKAKHGMKRVGLVDPVFEKIFEAYGTDQVEARYLLPPDFMQTLVDLESSVDGKNIRFGFEGGQLHIAVATEDRYEAGSMFEPLATPTRTQRILDEIGAIYDVVDAVRAR